MQGPPSSLGRAFSLLETGRKAEGLLIINQLAVRNDPEAMVQLALLKWRGDVVPQDVAAARELFRRAAEAEHPVAAAAHTNLLASGIAGRRDWPAALKRLRREARQDGRRAAILSLVEKMELTSDGDPPSPAEGQILSEAPKATLFPNAFSPAECDYLVRVAEPAFVSSLVEDGRGGHVRDPIRTSDGSPIHWLIEDPAIHALNRRLAALSGTRYDQGEPLQILRYRPGEQYHPHVDWLGEENQRVLTALVYLNDGYEGGETKFVKTGLRVRGSKGDALIFRSSGPGRQLDPLSEHAGLPVTRGTKYIASRWIRERRHIP